MKRIFLTKSHHRDLLEMMQPDESHVKTLNYIPLDVVP